MDKIFSVNEGKRKCTQTFRKKTSWSNHVGDLYVDVDDNIKIKNKVKMAYFYAKYERLPAVVLLLSLSGIVYNTVWFV
jgi:hypothetical protein